MTLPQSRSERAYQQAYDKVLEPWREKGFGYGSTEVTLAHRAGLQAVVDAALSETGAQDRIDSWNGALQEAINAGQDCFDAGGGWSEAIDAIRTLRSK